MKISIRLVQKYTRLYIATLLFYSSSAYASSNEKSWFIGINGSTPIGNYQDFEDDLNSFSTLFRKEQQFILNSNGSNSKKLVLGLEDIDAPTFSESST